MGILGYWGHGGSAATIIALVVSAAFLIWISSKEGQPFVKFGKVVAWIAIVLSSLLIVGQLYKCVYMSYNDGWCKPHMMKGYHMRGPGKGQWKMERGMKKGPMAMPPGRAKIEDDDDNND